VVKKEQKSHPKVQIEIQGIVGNSNIFFSCGQYLPL
jgi:hypothetical protein